MNGRSITRSSYRLTIDMWTVTVSPKFQVVIPRALRDRLELRPGAKLMVVEFNGGLCLMPIQPAASLRGIAHGISPDIEREHDRLL
jgi:AbrB family looped-hinge helix DNA binding protein